MKRYGMVYWCCGLVPLSLAGCGAAQNALHDTARSIVVAHTYDRATVAARQGDEQGLERDRNEIRALWTKDSGARSVAQDSLNALVTPMVADLVAQAIGFDTKAESAPVGSGQQIAALRESAALYRRALHLAGSDFTSDEPMLLNALGYFLADRGSSVQDFQQAEKLTRKAVDIYSEQISQSGAQWTGENLVAERALVRDSLAWALYKQHRYTEAAAQQEPALKDWRASNNNADYDAEADLVYHLGAIRVAQGKPVEARQLFEQALRLKPDHDGAQRALKSLKP